MRRTAYFTQTAPVALRHAKMAHGPPAQAVPGDQIRPNSPSHPALTWGSRQGDWMALNRLFPWYQVGLAGPPSGAPFAV